MQSITKNMEKTMDTTQEMAKSQQRAFEALADNVRSFQGRNAEVAKGWSDFLELQQSNSKAAQDLFTSSMRFAELGQRNVRFMQKWMGQGVNFMRNQSESSARTAEVVAQSASEQQESFRKLAEQWTSTYQGLFASFGSYAEEGLKNAQQLTEQTTHQGLRVAEEAVEQTEQVIEQTVEQTERMARQADPTRLPIKGYDELNVSEVSAKLDGLTAAELTKLEAYEKGNKNRDTVIEQIERKIKATS